MTPEARPLLKKMLLRGGGKSRRIWAWLALFLGSFFLLLAVSMWWNFRQALRGSSGKDALGSGYFTVSRIITDADMGIPGKVRFTDTDIAALQQAPGVEEVGKLTQAAFPVSASMGGNLGFSTLLFLEAVPDNMLDTLPPDWRWTPGRNDVPIILAKEFLRTYNYVFAPTQGLPQLSENAVKAIGFNLLLGNSPETKLFRGQIVGFSDRVTSVLVPQAFLAEMHRQFHIPPPPPARLLVRAKDPADPQLVDWLKGRSYEVGGEMARQATLRRVVDGVAAGLGFLALVLLASGLSLFILLIRLLLSEARDRLRLLREIGYSPAALGRFVAHRFVPQAVGALLVALLASAAANVISGKYLARMGVYWPLWPSAMVWGAWLLVVIVVVGQVWRSIRRAIG